MPDVNIRLWQHADSDLTPHGHSNTQSPIKRALRVAVSAARELLPTIETRVRCVSATHDDLAMRITLGRPLCERPEDIAAIGLRSLRAATQHAASPTSARSSALCTAQKPAAITGPQRPRAAKPRGQPARACHWAWRAQNFHCSTTRTCHARSPKRRHPGQPYRARA
jgi:hypothetical protein